MSDDYGKKAALAIAAVRQLHSDTSRLLIDCDKEIGAGAGSYFGSAVTRDLTYAVNPDCWMAEAVFRYYQDQAEPFTYRGVTVCFFDRAEPVSDGVSRQIPEPLLILGVLKYKPTTDAAKPEHWDLWSSYFDWSKSQKTHEVLVVAGADAEERVEWARIVTVPLYSISSIASVKQWMEKLSPHGSTF